MSDILSQQIKARIMKPSLMRLRKAHEKDSNSTKRTTWDYSTKLSMYCRQSLPVTQHVLDTGGIVAAILQLEWFGYITYLLPVHTHGQMTGSVKTFPYCALSPSVMLTESPDLKCPFMYSHEVSVKQFELQPNGEKTNTKAPLIHQTF